MATREGAVLLYLGNKKEGTDGKSLLGSKDGNDVDINIENSETIHK